jgi:hypothetical protein
MLDHPLVSSRASSVSWGEGGRKRRRPAPGSRRDRLLGCLISAWLAALPAAAQARGPDLSRPDWSIYRGSGLTVDYPSAVFTVHGGEPSIGHGSELQTADGRARLMIYSLDNPAKLTPRRYLDEHLSVSMGAFDYRRITDRFFVVSGIKENKTYYSRCNFGRGAVGCVYIQYPENETHAWDGIVTRISRSLRVAGD